MNFYYIGGGALMLCALLYAFLTGHDSVCPLDLSWVKLYHSMPDTPGYTFAGKSKEYWRDNLFSECTSYQCDAKHIQGLVEAQKLDPNLIFPKDFDCGFSVSRFIRHSEPFGYTIFIALGAIILCVGAVRSERVSYASHWMTPIFAVVSTSLFMLFLFGPVSCLNEQRCDEIKPNEDGTPSEDVQEPHGHKYRPSCCTAKKTKEFEDLHMGIMYTLMLIYAVMAFFIMYANMLYYRLYGADAKFWTVTTVFIAFIIDGLVMVGNMLAALFGPVGKFPIMFSYAEFLSLMLVQLLTMAYGLILK